MSSNYRYAERKSAKQPLTKVTALAIIEVKMCNPNGDSHEEGGPPRLCDGHGMISLMSIKRKWRDLVADGHPAYKAAVDDLGLDPAQYGIAMKKMEGTNDQTGKIAGMLNTARAKGRMPHVDVRLFGGFFAPSRGDKPKQGETEPKEPKDPFTDRGALVVAHAPSIAPIEIQTQGITRSIGMSQTSTGEDKDGGMGTINFVKYALYAAPIYFCPTDEIIERTLVMENDIELFRRVLPFIGDIRSATRTHAEVIHLYWYEHERSYGDIADHRILDTFEPKLIEGRTGQSLNDYAFFDPKSEEAIKTFGKNISHAHDFER